MGSNPTPPVYAGIHYHLEEFEKYLQGRVRKATARGYRKIVHVLRKLGDLDDPGKIRTIICTAPVSEARKELRANAYDYYCKFKEYAWDRARELSCSERGSRYSCFFNFSNVCSMHIFYRSGR